MSAKLKAFGWDVEEVDGHNVPALCSALNPDTKRTKPLAVVMHTVKGKGLSFAENDNSWHHAVVTQNAYEQGLKDLGF
jgi:transketolase